MDALALQTLAALHHPWKFFAGMTGAASIGGTGGLFQVFFDTVLFDNNGNFNAKTGLYTAPVSGYYVVCGGIKLVGYTGEGRVEVWQNGASKITSGNIGGSGLFAGESVDGVLLLNQGDTLGLYAAQNTGGNLLTQADGACVNTFLSAHFISFA